MENTKIRKLSEQEMYDASAGFALVALFAALVPLTIQAVSGLISAIKIYQSDSGSLKMTGGYESHWETQQEKAKTTKAEAHKNNISKTIVFAY